MQKTTNGRPAEILLVEDNPSDARLAAEALKQTARESRLHWAADGIQAMEFLQREGRHAGAPRPDLILLDLNLPRMDGRDILAALRRSPGLRGIPVVVLTCSDAETDRTQAYDLQANCFVTKPLQWDGFVKTMQAIVQFWLAPQPAGTGVVSNGPAPSVASAAASPEARVSRPACPIGRNGILRILLIEDNPADARLVREMLAEAGPRRTKVVEAARLGDGLRRLGDEQFDAVLIDLALPDSRGLDTLATVRAQASDVPLVVMTGLGDEQVAARALREGAQDYLVKGEFGGDLLLRAVGHAIERARSGRLDRYLAEHDPLTGLPNRIRFEDRSNQAVEHARRNGLTFAVLFIDLDHFKQVNDILGHGVGDDLLVEVAARLRSCVRSSDTVARVGGDEFTVLLPDVNRVQDAGMVADKIRQVLGLPFFFNGREVPVSVSIGVSLYPKDGEEAKTLVRNADAAMYRAKAAGRSNCKFYSSAR